MSSNTLAYAADDLIAAGRKMADQGDRLLIVAVDCRPLVTKVGVINMDRIERPRFWVNLDDLFWDDTRIELADSH